MSRTRTRTLFLCLGVFGCGDEDPSPANALLPGSGSDVVPAVDTREVTEATDEFVTPDPGLSPLDVFVAELPDRTPSDVQPPSDLDSEPSPDAQDEVSGDVPVTPDTDSPPVDCGDWSTVASEPGEGDGDFPWGVASGSLRGNRIVLWARLESAGEVMVHVSGGPACEDVTFGPVAATVDAGLVVHVQVTELQPGRLYRYRFERVDGAGPGSAAWFRTPSAEDVPVAVLFAGDTDSGHPAADFMWEAMEATPAERLLWLGDWPYADKNGLATTLDEYREKHAQDRASPLVQDFLRYLPIDAQWDDHEIMNDWDAANEVEEPLRVAAGKQAFREWFPAQGDVDGEIYRRYSLGPNIEAFQLDCRSHRDANEAPNDAFKTMLGDLQLAWLLDGLADSTAAFKLILTSVPLDYGTTGSDHWPGFVSELDAIVDAIRDEGITGVVFLTADQHWLSVHDMPSGLKEWQVGPAGTFTREPAPQPLEVLFQVPVLNVGLLEYQPAPPRLTFTAIDESSVPLYSETIRAGRGALTVAPTVATASWSVTGTHLFYGSGTRELPIVTPGSYTIFWGPAGNLPPPSPETLVLEDGDSLTFVGDYDGAGPVLWEPFSSGSLGAVWTVVNQGLADATPAWAVTGGHVREAGNAYDQKTDETVIPKLGTFLWAQGTTLEEGALVAQLYAGDDDGIGLMYGIQDSDCYYRISFDAENSFARLVRVDNGAFTVLAEDLDFAPPVGVWTTVAVERQGSAHRIYAEGRLLFDVVDDTYPTGSIALYSWGMSEAGFDDVAVYGP